MSKKEARPRAVAARGNGQDVAVGAVDKEHSTDELLRNVRRVELFFDENPSLLAELDAYVERHIAHGRKFAIQEVVERWRWYRPVLRRYLCGKGEPCHGLGSCCHRRSCYRMPTLP